MGKATRTKIAGRRLKIHLGNWATPPEAM